MSVYHFNSARNGRSTTVFCGGGGASNRPLLLIVLSSSSHHERSIRRTGLGVPWRIVGGCCRNRRRWRHGQHCRGGEPAIDGVSSFDRAGRSGPSLFLERFYGGISTFLRDSPSGSRASRGWLAMTTTLWYRAVFGHKCSHVLGRDETINHTSIGAAHHTGYVDTSCAGDQVLRVSNIRISYSMLSSILPCITLTAARARQIASKDSCRSLT